MIRLFNIHCILFLALAVLGCDSGVNTDAEVQYVAEVAWRPTGNAMLGFVQYFVATPSNPDPGLFFGIARIDGSGKIGGGYTTKEPAYDNFYYGMLLTLFPTADDQSVIAQLGRNIYRINLGSGADEQILVDFHLAAVSPDGRFVVGTHSQRTLPIKSVFVYDVSSATPRQVVRFDVDSLSAVAGLWLNEGQFAVTVNDSVGRHIDIYDTTGALKHRIGGGGTPSHNADFIEATNHLYFRANDGSIGMYDLNAKTETQPIHATVQNFDVSRNEQFIYFSTGINGSLKKHNLTTDEESELANNVFWGVFLSPDESRIAYVYEKKINFQEVKVLDLP